MINHSTRLFKIQQGFTLAEVLITLVIIGVIAAMTLPSLMQSTNKQEILTALKKADSVIRQSLYRITANNGYPMGDYSFLSDGSDTIFLDEFAKVVNVIKEGQGMSDYKFLNNSRNYTFSDAKYVITADGMLYSAFSTYNMSKYGVPEEDYFNCKIAVVVDVNGRKKPNKIGEDTFVFYIADKKGVIPAGTTSDWDCQPGDQGMTCGGKFLREGKVSYHPYQMLVD